ncbi:uncharacterized protein [Asterias amurensis]|uniref:uncharacterized protein n=1 Tax=Asterias amurensis TaxID=7602 RepID=UPI003AB52246
MQNYILSIALVVAMLALLATPTTSDEALNGDMEMDDEAMQTLKDLIEQSGKRVERSWRKPCQDNSCIQSGNRGWKRTGQAARDPISVNQRGSPFSMDNFKCVGESCSRGWKRTPEQKR